MSIPLAIRITSRKTKEEHVFSSIQQGNEFLGRSKGYLQNRIREQNTMTGENYDGELFDVEILGAGKRRGPAAGADAEKYAGDLCGYAVLGMRESVRLLQMVKRVEADGRLEGFRNADQQPQQRMQQLFC